MKRVLTVGVTYTGENIEGVEIENLGLCQAGVDKARAAFPLYEYDTIIINPQSYSHFLFGAEGEFSNEPNELGKLKRQNDSYDIDAAFDAEDREKEMEAAIAAGATVVWCLSEPKRMNFFGYRETHLGFAAPKVAGLVKRSALLVKKGRRMGTIDHDSPFVRYFDVLSKTGWSLCLSGPAEGLTSIASTPEGYSLGGHVVRGTTVGWLLTPPTSAEAENQLVRDSLALEKVDPAHEKYHGIFLSHTGVDKPFVRRLRGDLLAHGVPRVWLDEAEIDIGDSLIAKIDEGMKLSRYIAVVLSKKSIDAPWVKKELDVAMNREITSGEVVVLPLLYEPCELPEFLKGKMYADFSKPEEYEAMLAALASTADHLMRDAEGGARINSLDFSGLTNDEANAVRMAISRAENFHGYIPVSSLEFIVRNYRELAALGALEAPWLDAYVHASHFNAHGLSVLKAVFDACDRDRLRSLKPLAGDATIARRLTLFRGCAGPVHTMGMSWTSSLDKAIWYAAHHAEFYDLSDCAVYVVTVPADDIYCRLDHYDNDFIAYPQGAWRIEVPSGEFRLDRPPMKLPA